MDLRIERGREAGEPDSRGACPPGFVYGRVQSQLDEFDRIFVRRAPDFLT